MICVLPAVVYSRKDQSIIMPNLGQTISYDNTYINEGNVKKIVCKKSSDLRDFGIKNTEMETRVNGGFNALPNFRKISVPNILPQTYHTPPRPTPPPNFHPPDSLSPPPMPPAPSLPTPSLHLPDPN